MDLAPPTTFHLCPPCDLAEESDHLSEEVCSLLQLFASTKNQKKTWQLI